MTWNEEMEKNIFWRDVERALGVVGKINRAVNYPSRGPVVVYEYQREWWRWGIGGKPVTHQAILDPTDKSELTRYKKIAGELENYAKDPDKHNQIWPKVFN